jgi:membrane-bound inhibitor of C-type lysozyme
MEKKRMPALPMQWWTPRTRGWFAVAFAFLLAACETGLPPRPGELVAGQTVRYRCDDGFMFTAQFDAAAQLVVLQLPDRTLQLRRQPGVVAAKYSNGQTSFWTDGPQALIGEGVAVAHKGCYAG